MVDSKVRFFWGILAASAVVLTLPMPPAGAQVLYGSLVWNIKDSSGAVIGGALVEATQQQTQVARSAATDANGHYSLSNLPPGDYDLKITAQGFKTSSKQHIPIVLN